MAEFIIATRDARTQIHRIPKEGGLLLGRGLDIAGGAGFSKLSLESGGLRIKNVGQTPITVENQTLLQSEKKAIPRNTPITIDGTTLLWLNNASLIQSFFKISRIGTESLDASSRIRRLYKMISLVHTHGLAHGGIRLIQAAHLQFSDEYTTSEMDAEYGLMNSLLKHHVYNDLTTLFQSRDPNAQALLDHVNAQRGRLAFGRQDVQKELVVEVQRHWQNGLDALEDETRPVDFEKVLRVLRTANDVARDFFHT